MLTKLGFRGKLLVLLAVPVTAVLVFGALGVWRDVATLEELQRDDTLVDFALETSALAHGLQNERDMSAGVLGAQGGEFAGELQAARGAVDTTLADYRDAFAVLDHAALGEEADGLAGDALTELKRLSQLRAAVDAGELSGEEATARYTAPINKLLESVALLSKRPANAQVANQLAGYANFLRSLEFAAEERALLEGVFAAGSFAAAGEGAYDRLLALRAAERNYLDVARDFMDSGEEAQLEETLHSQTVQAAERLRATALDGRDAGDLGVEAHAWFEAQSAKINALARLETTFAEHLDHITNTLRAGARWDLWITAAAVLGAIVITALLGLWIVRQIVRGTTAVIDELSSAATQTLVASEQLSESSQSLSQGASEQAASLEETSSTVEELASMTRTTAENARRMDSLADEADSSARRGAEAMDRMQESVREIKASSDETASIVKTIDEIAFQTNLLALNAAVEAARAGDAGRGFAVVAEEVRNLAQRSAEAARNTAELIQESQRRADAGTSVSEEARGTLDAIGRSVQEVNSLVGEVSSSTQEQARGLEQVNTTVTEMDKVVQASASNAEENASASEELTSQADSLRRMVDTLESLVNGSGSRHDGAASASGGNGAAQVGHTASGGVRALPHTAGRSGWAASSAGDNGTGRPAPGTAGNGSSRERSYAGNRDAAATKGTAGRHDDAGERPWSNGLPERVARLEDSDFEQIR